MINRLILNIVTYNKLHKFWEHVLIEKEYFDEIRIFDANSTDGTEEFCKVHNIKYIPYSLNCSHVQDGFSKILEYGADGEWLCIHDSDEWFTRDFLRNIRRVVDESNDGIKYNIISTLPIDIALDVAIHESFEFKTNKLENDVEFKKEVVFRWYPNLSFQGVSHQYLLGIERNPLYVNYGYYHSKTTEEFCESCVFFTFADIVNNDLAFTITHFSNDEVTYLRKLFEINKICTVDDFYKFWSSKNYSDDFISFCKGCFEEIVPKTFNNGSIVSQRMAWFLYLFKFNKK